MKPVSMILLMLVLVLSGMGNIAQARPDNESTPSQRLKITVEDNKSVYTTVGERNDYTNLLRLSQPIGDYKFTAGMLYNGDNPIILHRIDDQGIDTECARINLRTVVTANEEEAIDGIGFSTNPPSSQTTITQAMLPDNWGTNGSNLIWQTSGYAYISGSGGLTYTIPDGYSNATTGLRNTRGASV